MNKPVEIMSEIRSNFKPNEGETGIKKYMSMFTNLWKSGVNGKIALLVGSSAVVILLLIMFGGGTDGTSSATNSGSEVAESNAGIKDIPVIKGLYLGMSADEAWKVLVDLQKKYPRVRGGGSTKTVDGTTEAVDLRTPFKREGFCSEEADSSLHLMYISYSIFNGMSSLENLIKVKIENDKVSLLYFSDKMTELMFGNMDLKTFATALVENYAGIPELEYRDGRYLYWNMEKGYQVSLYEFKALKIEEKKNNFN